jgi:molybdenum cofactor cytidylyltransferase
MSGGFVTGLVLAAGGSKRLGRPKQLLPYGSGTLLGHVLATARECPFDQRLCVLGGGGPDVRDEVDLSDFTVVLNEHFGEGCSSSIAAALDAVDERADVLVLMLGDQPGVAPTSVSALLAGRRGAPLAVCRYSDGRGHPFVFSRSVFGDLAGLHGDKGVWKLLERRAPEVVEVPVAGPVPLDVDTLEDYEAVLRQSGQEGLLSASDAEAAARARQQASEPSAETTRA